MPNIVDRFGQLVDDAIPKPELARQLLLLGYRAKDVQLLLAPEKELTPARQYAAQIAMDAMIAPLAHPQRAALVFFEAIMSAPTQSAYPTVSLSTKLPHCLYSDR